MSSIVGILSLCPYKDAGAWSLKHISKLPDDVLVGILSLCPYKDAGAWSLKLPPAIAELQVWPHWYAVRLPHMHRPGVNSLRSLTLNGLTVLRQEFLLTGLPSLEDLHINSIYRHTRPLDE
ncbi:hypothetical protein ACP70R_043948 [Stipagrostis hirtigluma subsp. patula]